MPVVDIAGQESTDYERDDRTGPWWRSLLKLCSDPRSRKGVTTHKVPGLYAHGMCALKLLQDDGFTITEIAQMINKDKGQVSRLIKSTKEALQGAINPDAALQTQFAELNDTAAFEPLTDQQWQTISHLFPKKEGGRPHQYSDREVVDAMRFVMHRRCRWSDISTDPSVRTLQRRFKVWNSDSTWNNAMAMLSATDQP